MKSIKAILSILVCLVISYNSFAAEKSAFDLSGEWQVGFDQTGNISVENIPNLSDGFSKITVPFYRIEINDEKNTKFIWLKKEFTLTEKQTALNSVLRWKQIFFGATAYINEVEVGKTDLTAPYCVKIEKGVLKTGKNTIYLKVSCWAGLSKTTSGKALIPAGSASFDWGDRAAKVSDEIFLDFFEDVYIINTVILPELKDNSLKIKVRFLKENTVLKTYFDLIIRDKAGNKIIDSTSSFEGDNTVELTAQIDKPVLWDLENPYLYACELTARGAGAPYLSISQFGMRNFAVKDGHFYLNGKRIVLKGSELVMDWQNRSYLKNKTAVLEYAVEQAKQMNFNCFRTHTLPPPDSWLDIFDKYGMLILAEFPLTFNGLDFKFTPEEEDLFQKNSVQDAKSRVYDLANHPSIIAWAISNEPKKATAEWELTTLQKEVKDLDPTRPILRAGALSEEARDIHPYQGFWYGSEGLFYSAVTKFATLPEVSFKNKALMCTEYMEAYNQERQLRWSGKKKESQKDDIVYAEFCAEQTEILRRLNFDAMLPYWYAYWDNQKSNFEWRKDVISPALLAFKSAFSPVFASIDLFNRNFISGSPLNTDIYYINDTDKPVDAEFDFFITDKNPEYLPYSEALLKPLYSATVLKTLKSNERTVLNFEWKLPDVEGVYYFSVVTQVPGMAPAISQREIHALSRSRHPSVLDKITLAGTSSSVEEVLTLNHVRYTKEYYESIETGILLACSLKEFQNEYAVKNQIFESFFERGGTAVILEDEGNVPFKVPVELKTIANSSSRAFITESFKDSPLLQNINPAYLARWNDFNGTCYRDPIQINNSPAGEKNPVLTAILTGAKPGESPLVTFKYKKGTIILSRLDIKKRISPRSNSYDPVAERMLLNMLAVPVTPIK